MSIAGVSDSEWLDFDGQEEPLPGLSIAMLFASGAIEGPFRLPKPVRLSLLQRLRLAVRDWSLKP